MTKREETIALNWIRISAVETAPANLTTNTDRYLHGGSDIPPVRTRTPLTLMLLRSIWDSQQSDYFMEGRKVKENGAGVGEVGKSRRQEDKGEREEALQGSPPYYGSVPFGIYLQSLSVSCDTAVNHQLLVRNVPYRLAPRRMKKTVARNAIRSAKLPRISNDVGLQWNSAWPFLSRPLAGRNEGGPLSRGGRMSKWTGKSGKRGDIMAAHVQ